MPAVQMAYLVMVIAAFVTFMLVLGGVSTYVRITSRSEQRDVSEH